MAAQEATLRQYAAIKGHEVVAAYRDEGISAKDVRHRPEMQSLMEAARRREFDILLIWKLTRLTRSLADLCSICDLLEAHDVTLISVTESFDLTSSSGRLMLNILGSIAQWEREVISDNVRLAMLERARQGLITCSYVLGYDRVDDTLVVNPQEAAIVRYIYRAYMRHCNMRKVAVLCASRGYRGKRGATLRPESIHKILTRVVYCGYNIVAGRQ